MTCLETFATFRIFSDLMHPDEIENVLAIEATTKLPRDPSSRYRPRRETNLWEWCTRSMVDSRNNTAHLTAIIDRVTPRARALKKLQIRSCQTDISNYWVSSGQGGPTLNVEMMQALADLNLSIWWDVYFGKEDEHQSDA